MLAEPGSRFKLRGISRNVVALGWVSFFTDLASEMLYPVMPLFLIGVLGASPAVLGLIDGLAEGVSSSLRWLGGALSDRWQRRKPFVVAGYTISAISKPVMGLAQVFGGPWIFLTGRVSDRLGKSIRTSARDALIADSTAAEFHGIAFGFHRAMDTCGAVLGPLMTLAILSAIVGFSTAFSAHWNSAAADHTQNLIAQLPLRKLFYFAVVPGLISAVLVFTVREIPPAGHDPKAGPPPIFQSFPKPFWILILANAVFSLGNSSDSFLLLRSGELGLGFGAIVLTYAVYNTVYAIASTPLGHLSDRIGRKPVIAVGWCIYAAVYMGFAMSHSRAAPWVLLATYGLFQAFTEGITKAMVSDLVPSEKRAGAIGLLYTASGFCVMAASALCGLIWNVRWFGDRIMAAFAVGAIFAVIAAVIICLVPTERPRRASNPEDESGPRAQSAGRVPA
jgi:MFS family permease